MDYVDYDEIAHHAGSARVESLACLAGLDQVLAPPPLLHRRGPPGSARATTSWS